MSTCACGTTLGRRNRSGSCRPCTAKRINSDPAIALKRVAAIRERTADPAVRAQMGERMRQVVKNMTPEQRERRREHGRNQVRKFLSRPDVKARTQSPEVRARAGKSRSETEMAWCPPHLRETYRELTRKGRRAPEAKALIADIMNGKSVLLYAEHRAKLDWCPEDRRDEYRKWQKAFGAAEARRMMEEDIATAEKRRRAAMTPLEKQIERLQNGATLVERLSFSRAEHAFSLTGNATAML